MEASDIVTRLTGQNGEWLPDATADPNDYTGQVVRYAASEEKVNQAEKARLDALDAIRKAKGEKANMNGVYVTVEERVYDTSAD